ncbi:unnamed protein product, partial [Phaeothamnion confervicola]
MGPHRARRRRQRLSDLQLLGSLLLATTFSSRASSSTCFTFTGFARITPELRRATDGERTWRRWRRRPLMCSAIGNSVATSRSPGFAARPLVPLSPLAPLPRDELEGLSYWPIDTGRLALPCSIKIAPRADGRSLFYANGTEIFTTMRGGILPRAGAESSTSEGVAAAGPAIDWAHAVSTSIRLVGELSIAKPAYLKVVETAMGASASAASGGGGDRKGESGSCELLITQFGLARSGGLASVDFSAISARPRLTRLMSGPLQWPNEVTAVPAGALAAIGVPLPPSPKMRSLWARSGAIHARSHSGPPPPLATLNGGTAARISEMSATTEAAAGAAAAQGAPALQPPPPPTPPLELLASGLLVADGFLLPGRADGGVYLVLPPGTGGQAASGTGMAAESVAAAAAAR